MVRIEGTLARQLDFGDSERRVDGHTRRLPLSRRPRLLRGPGKYTLLERRRRRAQIAARHLLDLVE